MISFLIKGQSFYSIEFADSLYNQKNYELAATCYERVYCFSHSIDERIECLIARANCFKKLTRHYEAYNSLVRINNYELSDSLKCYTNYQLALNLYLSNYFKDAEMYCAKNYALPVNTSEYKNSLFLHGLIYNELYDYKKAKAKFLEYNTSAQLELAVQDTLNKLIINQYDVKNIPKLKSLKKARTLSKIIPGAGLFYAGKPGKALTNIGFQLLALGFTGANVYVANYITAASTGVFLMRSFYSGGVNQLNDVIPAINFKRTQKFNEQLKSNYASQFQK